MRAGTPASTRHDHHRCRGMQRGEPVNSVSLAVAAREGTMKSSSPGLPQSRRARRRHCVVHHPRSPRPDRRRVPPRRPRRIGRRTWRQPSSPTASSSATLRRRRRPHASTPGWLWRGRPDRRCRLVATASRSASSRGRGPYGYVRRTRTTTTLRLRLRRRGRTTPTARPRLPPSPAPRRRQPRVRRRRPDRPSSRTSRTTPPDRRIASTSRFVSATTPTSIGQSFAVEALTVAGSARLPTATDLLLDAAVPLWLLPL